MLQDSNSNEAFPVEGETFAERYEIGPLLGVGGFANVYRATQVDIGREVAIKILAPERVGRSEGLNTAERRFYREARLLSKLEGPNTIRLYDYGRTADGLLFTVFEYIDGTELDVLLGREGPFESDRAVHILEQILRSLHEAHSVDILHRDVKPSNVLVYNRLGEPDQVKLLDFGIAKMVAAEARGDKPLTRTGLVVGTPTYMSPEQAVDRPLGPPSDLFSAGLIFYEMLVGSSPYDDSSLSSIRDRMMSAPIRIPRSVEIDDELREIGNRLLERNVEDRFQRATEVLSALGVEFAEADDSASREPHRANEVSFPISLDTSGVAPVDALTNANDPAAATESSIQSPPTGEIPAADEESSDDYDPGKTIVDPEAGPPAPDGEAESDSFEFHDLETEVLDTAVDSDPPTPEPGAESTDTSSRSAEAEVSGSGRLRWGPIGDRSHIMGAALGAALALVILGVVAYTGIEPSDRSAQTSGPSVQTAGAEPSEAGRTVADRHQSGERGSNPYAATAPSARFAGGTAERRRDAGRAADPDAATSEGRAWNEAVERANTEVRSAQRSSISKMKETLRRERTNRRKRANRDSDPEPSSTSSASKPSTSSPDPAPPSPPEDEPPTSEPVESRAEEDESSSPDEIKPIDEYLK